MRHEDDTIKPNKNDDDENEMKDVEPETDKVLDTTPIVIESMDQANHTNMETTDNSDMVENFKQNMEFKLKNDVFQKRFDKDDPNNPNQNTNDMKDVDDPNIPDEFVKQDEDKKYFLIKDFFLQSRLTKLYPHLFINSALDWSRPRPRLLSEKEAMHKML